MISVKNVSHRYRHLEVLNGINLECQSGQSIALIGPNACGKTTLMKCLLGMVLPHAGTILINNINIKANNHYRSYVGYMPQIGAYPSNMTVKQILDTLKHLRNIHTHLDEELIDAYHLKDIFNKPMRALSGGTIQKVSAAIAFLFNPLVLILDEPSAGLDPLSTEILKEKILLEKKKGKLILMSSHQLSELDDLISEVVFIQNGKILFHKGIDALKVETKEDKISKAIVAILKNQHL